MHLERQKRLYVGPFIFVQDPKDESLWIIPGSEPKNLPAPGCKHVPPRPHRTMSYSEAYVLAVENGWSTPQSKEVDVYYKVPTEVPANIQEKRA